MFKKGDKVIFMKQIIVKQVIVKQVIVKQILAGLLFFLFLQPAQAILKIDITKGEEGALPIAVVPFQWNTAKLPDADVSAIIVSDLARSGKFSPQAEDELIAHPQKPENIHFKSWRIAGMDHLVIGSVNRQADGTFQVQFRLFDVLTGQQVLGYSFTATKKTLRTVAHQISDYIFTKLTGLPGAFNTHIAYITVQRDVGKRDVKKSTKNGTIYRLQVSDTDGYNPQTLLKSDEPIMSLAWSPDGSQLAYVSFEKGHAQIYTQNIHTGVRKLQSSFPGLNGAPAWSPDGKKLAMTLSKDGNPDIYILNLKDRSLRRFTTHWSIDTEAAWTPDGKSIIFTSNRGGTPQLYIKPITGKIAPRRLTFDGNYNTSASLSPDGKLMAYIQGTGNVYRIALMTLASGNYQVLTSGPEDESPSFAPNNSMILFASEDKNHAVLSAVSTDGKDKQTLSYTAGEVREPAWAPVRH